MAATALTLGSGGYGGIFSRSLFLGATFGGAYGILVARLFPGLALTPPACAVARMAAADQIQHLLVEDRGKVVGVLKQEGTLDIFSRNSPAAAIGEVAAARFEVVREPTTMFDIIARMHSGGLSLFLVASTPGPAVVGDVRGVISKERIADALAEAISLSRQHK